MSSGLYSAVSGAMSRLRMMDTISDNLSNGQTVGFKKGGVSFEALLERPARPQDASGVDYVQVKEGFSDFAQGGLTKTGLPFQLAIDGGGFFKVQDANGQVFLTRQGNMRRDPNGTMISPQGMKLLGEDGRPLSFPNGEVVIDEQGMAALPDGGKVRVPIYSVPEVAQLERLGGGLFKIPQPETLALQKDPHVFQGYVENSNVNTMQEVGRMMESLRAFEACQKVMNNFSELNGKIIEVGIIG